MYFARSTGDESSKYRRLRPKFLIWAIKLAHAQDNPTATPSFQDAAEAICNSVAPLPMHTADSFDSFFVLKSPHSDANC